MAPATQGQRTASRERRVSSEKQGTEEQPLIPNNTHVSDDEPENESSNSNDAPTAENGDQPNDSQPPWYKRKISIGAVVGAAFGATVAVVAAPLVIGAIGFGAGGIVAGSIAASMMSSAAIASGGGVAAGSLVAILSSIGAAGFGLAGLATVGAAGATVGAAVGTGIGAASENAQTNGENGDTRTSVEKIKLETKKQK